MLVIMWYVCMYGLSPFSKNAYVSVMMLIWCDPIVYDFSQYEYGLYSTSATTAPERYAQILPIWEQIDLQDYRLRQATYYLDEGLRNLRYVFH